jgi:molybdopterin synthase catalytic subunit
MSSEIKHRERDIFVEGPIDPMSIGESIAKHAGRTEIGAHEIFLGQVRADVVNGNTVEAIDYSTYKEMALAAMTAIREETFGRWPLTCLHVYHSIGRIAAGQLCFMVFASSAHRSAAREAVAYVTDQVKERLPIYGREIFAEGGHTWKKNT